MYHNLYHTLLRYETEEVSKQHVISEAIILLAKTKLLEQNKNLSLPVWLSYSINLQRENYFSEFLNKAKKDDFFHLLDQIENIYLRDVVEALAQYYYSLPEKEREKEENYSYLRAAIENDKIVDINGSITTDCSEVILHYMLGQPYCKEILNYAFKHFPEIEYMKNGSNGSPLIYGLISYLNGSIFNLVLPNIQDVNYKFREPREIEEFNREEVRKNIGALAKIKYFFQGRERLERVVNELYDIRDYSEAQRFIKRKFNIGNKKADKILGYYFISMFEMAISKDNFSLAYEIYKSPSFDRKNSKNFFAYLLNNESNYYQKDQVIKKLQELFIINKPILEEMHNLLSKNNPSLGSIGEIEEIVEYLYRLNKIFLLEVKTSSHVDSLIGRIIYNSYNFPWLKNYIIKNIIDITNHINTRNDRGGILLHLAAEAGDEVVAEFLINHGSEIDFLDYQRKTPLHVAAQHNAIKIAKQLLERGASLDKKDIFGKTALHWAAKYNNYEIAKLLIDQGGSLSIKDYHHVTPLHLAICSNSVEVAELLLQNKASPNTVNDEGVAPLFMVARHGYVEVAELLIKYGANLDIINCWQETALHTAISWKNPEIARIFIRAGMNVNQKNYMGNTALHLAVIFGDIALVSDLLAKGADINAVDQANASALKLAIQYNMRDIAKLLIENGAKLTLEEVNLITDKFHIPPYQISRMGNWTDKKGIKDSLVTENYCYHK